jgi:hypothetical protein
MYAKIINGIVEKYPYTIGNLRKDYPNVSFPKNVTDLVLNTYNVFKVQPTQKPEQDYRKNYNVTVVNQNGTWVELWEEINATQEEINERTEIHANNLRIQRNELLSSSDWTQGKDIAEAMSNSWAIYREALRNVPQQEGFPWSVVWPVKPS